MSASITDLSPINDVIPLKNKINGGEFVSGSNQYQFSQLRNYKIAASVGSYQGEIMSKTPNKYTVYYSLQGSLISKK